MVKQLRAYAMQLQPLLQGYATQQRLATSARRMRTQAQLLQANAFQQRQRPMPGMLRIARGHRGSVSAARARVRDLREAQTIGLAMDHINRHEIAQAMDMLCQRLLALQMAKGKTGGTWAAILLRSSWF